MQKLTVIYGRSWKPISLLIQLRTLSHWSHVGVIDGDSVIEAVGGQGVVVTPIDEFKKRYRQTVEGQIYCLNRDEAMHYLRSRIGARYDKLAVVGFALALGWDDIEAYHCAELVAGASGIANPYRLNEISPGTLRKFTHDNTQRVFTDR